MAEEVKTESNEIKEQGVVTPAPEQVNPAPEQVIEVKEYKTIIPKIILPLTALSKDNVPWATCDNLWNTCRCKGIRRTDCPPHNEKENTPAFEYYL
ncbi:unnamed protein product [Orchesella dallaii]|uniref:Uncharacterized protein n=1 Tax=Orchesella dallaii TaxID=48710 RepID=A0ABP1PKC4_9HEXA